MTNFNEYLEKNKIDRKHITLQQVKVIYDDRYSHGFADGLHEGSFQGLEFALKKLEDLCTTEDEEIECKKKTKQQDVKQDFTH
jgi:hypothetical protein